VKREERRQMWRGWKKGGKDMKRWGREERVKWERKGEGANRRLGRKRGKVGRGKRERRWKREGRGSRRGDQEGIGGRKEEDTGKKEGERERSGEREGRKKGGNKDWKEKRVGRCGREGRGEG
jgi:hypothetical protein